MPKHSFFNISSLGETSFALCMLCETQKSFIVAAAAVRSEDDNQGKMGRRFAHSINSGSDPIVTPAAIDSGGGRSRAVRLKLLEHRLLLLPKRCFRKLCFSICHWKSRKVSGWGWGLCLVAQRMLKFPDQPLAACPSSVTLTRSPGEPLPVHVDS